MLLASLLHRRELAIVELVPVDVSPVVAGAVHGEARSDGAVGADDHVVLAGAALPFRKM